MMKAMTSSLLSTRPALAGLMLAVSTAALSSSAAEPTPDRPPNIIFMLADDLGYGDLSCYNPNAGGEAPNNTPIRTPVLDSMAKNGVRLTDFHSAAPLCSPSRRALLSARYASRLGEWAEAYRGSPDGMVAAREPTIGMWLKQAGYATACYGKWNVGEVKDVSWPGAHGFDDWLIIDHNTGYFQHQNKNKDCQGREMLFGTGGTRVTTLRGKYLTDIWTDKALEFIDANAAKPFFLYLPFAVPHSPLQDPADPSLAFDEQPKAETPAAREAFVKMVEYLDSRIAKIFQVLEKRGLTDNTLVMFTSDNGGMRSGNCWPLKKQKQWLEEGGIRVPCLMQWPSVIPPGTVSAQASIMMDASVTMLAAGDALKHVPPSRKLDGIDLLPILQGKAIPIPDRVLGWRRRDWSSNFNSLRQEAFRSGDWKLLRTYKHAGGNKRSAEHTDELFNLADDVSEAKDLAGEYPEKLATMQAAFVRWQQEVVEQQPDYLIPVPDQLGSPAKYPPLSMLFDFKRDRLDGKLLTRNNEARISEPVIQDGVFKARLSPGLVHPRPLLYRDGAMATTVFSTMRVRMRVTAENGAGCGPAKALLRHDQWQGKDIPFDVHADGEWHEYVIDVTQSPAWRNWTPSGRIGMVMPEPAKSAVTVEIDFIKLDAPRKRLSAASAPMAEKPDAGRTPNFVFIFADDLGYRDLACYGHPYAKTPTLDQLASEGTRFIQAYAAGPTCMPSRTGIMTGRCVARFAKRPDDFDFGDRPTVTELLKNSGYATGHFGKWHIGMDRSNGVYGIDENDWGGKPDIKSPTGRDGGIFDAAIDFISKNKDKPFYVNIWGFTTHHPVVSAPIFIEEFADIKVDRKDFADYMQPVFDDCIDLGGDLDECMRHYVGNVYAFDQNVKSVLDTLDELGLTENTVVVFSSDQGPQRPNGIGENATGPEAKAKVKKQVKMFPMCGSGPSGFATNRWSGDHGHRLPSGTESGSTIFP